MNTNDFIKNRFRTLLEGFNMPNLRLVKPVEISDEEREAIKNVQSEDLVISDVGNDGHSIVHMKIDFPFDTDASDGIVVDIQLIQESIYQIHISLSKSLQDMGLGTKIYKALINDLGHLYSGKGRRMNPIVDKIWGKLDGEGGIECINTEKGNMCMKKGHPNRDDLIKFMQS